MERVLQTAEAIGNTLEAGGWIRSVAGAEDFKAVCDAVVSAFETPKRGIIVSGDYGVGKTMLCKILAPSATMINCGLRNEVEWLHPYEDNYVLDKFCSKNVIIDDMGAEALTNVYGVKRDLVGEFITLYHIKGKGRLFISTNMRGSEMAERYGGRIVSRLKDLCVPIRLTGKDKRKWVL